MIARVAVAAAVLASALAGLTYTDGIATAGSGRFVVVDAHRLPVGTELATSEHPASAADKARVHARPSDTCTLHAVRKVNAFHGWNASSQMTCSDGNGPSPSPWWFHQGGGATPTPKPTHPPITTTPSPLTVEVTPGWPMADVPNPFPVVAPFVPGPCPPGTSPCIQRGSVSLTCSRCGPVALVYDSASGTYRGSGPIAIVTDSRPHNSGDPYAWAMSIVQGHDTLPRGATVSVRCAEGQGTDSYDVERGGTTYEPGFAGSWSPVMTSYHPDPDVSVCSLVLTVKLPPHGPGIYDAWLGLQVSG